MANGEIVVKVRVEDTDWWKQIAEIMTDMLGDYRINAEVRKEYETRIEQVQG